MSKGIDRPWKLMPHAFASHLSRGKWRPYNYLLFLSHLLGAVIAKGEGRVLVSLPPRHGKSLFISQWVPAWYLENFPEHQVILTTYEATFAARWGRRVRDTLIEHREELDVRVNPDVAASNRWATTAGGGMITAGIGGPITGEGGQLLLVDDPHKNWQEAMSATTRDGIIDWYNSTFRTRAEPGATIVILHTRWHEKDLIGYCKDEADEPFIEINLPAVCEEENDVLDRKIGDPLCPERFDRKALQKLRRAVGEPIWAGLYQQRPMMEGGNIFKDWWWRYYTGKIPFQMKFQSWDTGFKKNETSAYSSCTTWGVGAFGNYMTDLWRERVEFPELVRAAINLYERDRPTAVLIEDKASGTPLIQTLQRNTSIPVIPIEPTKDKVIRAMEVSPVVEAGRVFLPEKAPWVAEFVQNAKTFPNIAFLDDIDSVTQFLKYAQQFDVMKGEVMRFMPRMMPRVIEGYR